MSGLGSLHKAMLFVFIAGIIAGVLVPLATTNYYLGVVFKVSGAIFLALVLLVDLMFQMLMFKNMVGNVVRGLKERIVIAIGGVLDIALFAAVVSEAIFKVVPMQSTAVYWASTAILCGYFCYRSTFRVFFDASWENA